MQRKEYSVYFSTMYGFPGSLTCANVEALKSKPCGFEVETKESFEKRKSGRSREKL